MAGIIDFGLLDTRAPERVAGSFYEGQQQQQQNALMQAQLQTAQRTNKLADLVMQDDEATRQAYQSSGGDMAKAMAALQQGGQYKQAMELQGKMSAQQKEALATQKAQLENHLKTFEVVGQIMSGVKDQASYDASRQQIAQIVGPEAAAKSPAVYDPAVIEQSRQKAMSVKDQLANKWKEIDAQLNADKFAETKANNLRVDSRANQGLAIQRGNLNERRAENNAPKSAGIGKPMPATALKMQQEELDAIGAASSINADMTGVENLIKSGKLDLGLIGNATGSARNYLGLSNESSKNLASFKATLEKMRNDSLRLNKGVQTDGDAVRAWNELLTNINDPEVVKQRLGEIKLINERAVNIRKMNVENIRRNYNAPELDTAGYESQKPAIGATGGVFSDQGKEARYQAWKASQGK